MPNLPGLHAARAAIYRQTEHADWAAVEDQRESGVPKPDCSSHKSACAYLAGEWLSALGEAEKSAAPEHLYWAALAFGGLSEQNCQHRRCLDGHILRWDNPRKR